jgi:hypothetical protein
MVNLKFLISKEVMMNRLAWMISGILLGLATWILPAAAGEPDNLLKLRKAKLEAARQTYNVVSKNFHEGPVRGVELPYRWSCRLLEAERQMSEQKAEQNAALKRHAERMRDVERVARDLYRARVNTINEVTAAEYYRMEAEIWLVEAGE